MAMTARDNIDTAAHSENRTRAVSSRTIAKRNANTHGPATGSMKLAAPAAIAQAIMSAKLRDAANAASATAHVDAAPAIQSEMPGSNTVGMTRAASTIARLGAATCQG